MKSKNNSMLRIVLITYTLVLCLAGAFVVRADFSRKWETHLQDIHKTLDAVEDKYKEITGEFWRYYLPLVTKDSSDPTILDEYFSIPSQAELMPIQRQKLMKTLSGLFVYFEKLEWVALDAVDRDINYVCFKGSENARLDLLTEEFAFNNALISDALPMKVIGCRKIGDQDYFAVVGGAPTLGSSGRMMFGFSLSVMDEIVQNSDNAFSSLGFHIVEDGEVIYSSVNPQELPWIAQDREMKTVNVDGHHVIVTPVTDSPRRSIVYATIDYGELFWKTCSEVYRSMIVLVGLLLISIAALLAFNALLNKEVAAIRYGLKRIGDNHLDYRFTPAFHNDGFNDIALAINRMAQELQRTLERSYQFELKQRETEMAELMAKFDPHFLYNTLELFRARSLRNGDERTASLIAHAAKLFRGLLSSKRIVTVQEELAFSEHYLFLFRERFGEQTRILYDFEAEVLGCFIIRNILQPLIENYFEHGFDNSRMDNYLKLSGKITSDQKICLTIQDNGRGIEDDQLDALRRQLSEPLKQEGESYGLKNLHQRIRLYYGEGYGLDLNHNGETGLSVSILLPVITHPPTAFSTEQAMTIDAGIKKAIEDVSNQ